MVTITKFLISQLTPISFVKYLRQPTLNKIRWIKRELVYYNTCETLRSAQWTQIKSNQVHTRVNLIKSRRIINIIYQGTNILIHILRILLNFKRFYPINILCNQIVSSGTPKDLIFHRITSKEFSFSIILTYSNFNSQLTTPLTTMLSFIVHNLIPFQESFQPIPSEILKFPTVLYPKKKRIVQSKLHKWINHDSIVISSLNHTHLYIYSLQY